MKVEIEQGSQEWLDLRRKHVGASDANVIMGTVDYGSVNDLILTKRGVLSSDNAYIKSLGDSAEMKLLKDYPNHTKQVFTKDIFIASLDGFDGESIVECKYVAIGNIEASQKYYPQCQLQMYVTDCRKLELVTIDALETVCRYYIEYNEDYVNEMLPKLREFHAKIDAPDNMDLLMLLEDLERVKGKEDEIKEAIFKIATDSQVCGSFKISYSKSADKEVPDYEATVKKLGVTPETKLQAGRVTRRITCVNK
jgi:hypothetical protein